MTNPQSGVVIHVAQSKIVHCLSLIRGMSVVLPALLLFGCTNSNETSEGQPAIGCWDGRETNSEFQNESVISIVGYSGSAMEPRISHDQVVLFFNDKPASGDSNMQIHYAIKQSSTVYNYIGEVTGANASGSLDGVPAVDSSGRFHFVSLRDYSATGKTLFTGTINVLGPSSLEIQNTQSSDGAIAAGGAGVVDMDIDVSWDGTLAIVSRATFAGAGYPSASFLKLFDVATGLLTERSDSSAILANVNQSGCVIYAASMSADKLELFYTQFPSTNVTADEFGVLVARRSSTSEPFGRGKVLSGLKGSFAEGPSLSFDDGGKTLFFHRFDSAQGKFQIYKRTRL